VAGKLSALGIRRLDLLIASHPHADHIIGLPAVLARYPVGVALEPGCPDGSPIRADLLRAFRDEGTTVEHPRAGASFAVADLRIDVLSPSRCYHGTESDANNDAIVVMLSWREDTILFATEPEEPAQQTMLESGARLQADVLKVPHHGAATSLPEFFEAVDPQLAVVSVGPNPYGHPVAGILDELRSTGAEVFRTDRAGDITIEFGSGGPRVDSAS
jgi:competence protein ComEC